MIACQWAKALGAKLIGTVGTAQKAQSALKAGAWQVINYREENLVERLKEITGGKKVRVVYDSVAVSYTHLPALHHRSKRLCHTLYICRI